MIRVINGQPVPYTKTQLKLDCPNTSFPNEMSLEFLAQFDTYETTVEEPPAYDAMTHKLVKREFPEYAVETGWQFKHDIVPLTQEELDQKLADNIKQMDIVCREYIDNAAHWSGGILANDKAKEGKVKAKAVADWTMAVWQEFYTRAAMLHGGAPFTPEMLDFSTVGTCPHTMAEVLAE